MEDFSVRSGARRTGRSRFRGHVALTIALIASLLALLPGTPAAAAGNAVLNVSLTPVDLADGSTITEIANGQHDNRITYRVQFSCGTEPCTDTTIQFAPSQPDPNGLLAPNRRLLLWNTWVPPTGGAATIGGTDMTGKLVNLGDLEPGDSGSFTMTYVVQGDRHREVSWSTFYPDGFDIEMDATIASPNAVADVTAEADDVTWHLTLPAASRLAAAISSPASAKTDEDVSYNLTMTGGNLYYGGGANITGSADWSAVGSYEVVFHAPDEAEIVSAEWGGVIDPVAKTVTWSVGSAGAPAFGARGGWGLNAVTGFNGAGNAADNIAGDPSSFARWSHRPVVLRFPGENFPDADETGCNFAKDVSSRMEVSVTYLDAARTTRTTSANRTNQVACWDPFGGMGADKVVSGGAASQFSQGDANLGGGVFAVNVPRPGEPDRLGPWWQVRVWNEGNVPGVAVIDEPNLEIGELRVDQIEPAGASATIEWARSDGETGTTNRNAGQALAAPAGTWFTRAKSTLTIGPGRIQPTDTTSTTASMYYRFRVPATAAIGEERTNTAQVSMTYPGYEDKITNVPLPIARTAPRTIRFTKTSPLLGAAFVGDPVVDGSPLTAGTEVTYTVRGTTNAVWPGTEIVPQIAFVAPVGWEIVPGSASIGPEAPAGVTFSYVTKTFGGNPRQVVIATWPEAIAPSATGPENWPALAVRATPTATAPTGNNAAVAHVRTADATASGAPSPAARPSARTISSGSPRAAVPTPRTSTATPISSRAGPRPGARRSRWRRPRRCAW